MTDIRDKIDAVTRIPPEYLATRLPAPRALKIGTTEHCNHSCGYCALRLREHSPQEMRREDFSRVIREAREAGVEELGVFFLGEPTMCEWIAEAIHEAKRIIGFPYVFMTTNGTSPRVLERLGACMLAGLDSLKFSLNYADADQYHEITGSKRKGFYDLLRTVRTCRHMRDYNQLSTRLWASSIQYDGEQAERMAEVVHEIEPYLDGPVYYLPLYSMGAFATQREEELGFRPIAGNQGRIGALREPLPCWSAFTEAHVSLDPERGTPYLSACCFDASSAWNMADLSQMSFMDGWNSRAFQELRAAHLQKDVTGTVCERCIAYT